MKLETALKSTNFQSPKHKAGLNVLYTAWWLKTIFSRELKEFGITHEQYNVLRILKGKHPEQMCVKDIACRIIEKNSNVPRIINRLEHKKLVNRTTSPADKRETVITLTDTGIELLRESTKKMNKVFDTDILLSDDEAGQLNELLEQFRRKE